MTKTRTGDPFMSAFDYGRQLPKFSVNLLVRNIAASLPFYRDVLGATVRYSDGDFAALELIGVGFQLHADHTFDHHPLHARLQGAGVRGVGAELRLLGVDPDAVEARAKAAGTEVLQSARDYRHGWREVYVADPDGYVWVLGVPIPAIP
jgi:catechol 2,3-dioxygenase-like lactoylglutathione lyase family enzyme